MDYTPGAIAQDAETSRENRGKMEDEDKRLTRAELDRKAAQLNRENAKLDKKLGIRKPIDRKTSPASPGRKKD
jgi:hypothetical protein